MSYRLNRLGSDSKEGSSSFSEQRGTKWGGLASSHPREWWHSYSWFQLWILLYHFMSDQHLSFLTEVSWMSWELPEALPHWNYRAFQCLWDTFATVALLYHTCPPKDAFFLFLSFAFSYTVKEATFMAQSKISSHRPQKYSLTIN